MTTSKDDEVWKEIADTNNFCSRLHHRLSKIEKRMEKGDMDMETLRKRTKRHLDDDSESKLPEAIWDRFAEDSKALVGMCNALDAEFKQVNKLSGDLLRHFGKFRRSLVERSLTEPSFSKDLIESFTEHVRSLALYADLLSEDHNALRVYQRSREDD